MAKRRWILLFLLVVSAVGCIHFLEITRSSSDLAVHFIDVGYGDSILIELPSGRNMLIDGGDRKAGEKVVGYLKERGIKRLDVVVVTHPHPDHIEGLFTVIERYKIDSIVANEDISESGNYAPFFEIVKGRGIPFKRAVREDVLIECEGIKMEALHPDKLTGDLNSDCLVIKLTYKKVGFLFTADIGQAICNELAQFYRERLKSDVLQIPHHGKSGIGEFLHMVSPEVAIVSVGPSIWGGPSEEILAEYKGREIKILRTDEVGTIVIRTDGDRIWF